MSRAGTDWHLDSDGQPRGYIQPKSIRELWFHTGTVCNLRCSFCLEGSKPGDNRLNALTLHDVKPFLEEAVKTMRELHRLGFHLSVARQAEADEDTEAERDAFMCSFSKMVVKQGGRMRVYACTLVDDDPDYDFGGTLSEAMPVRVRLKHHRCYTCFSAGASCSEL